MCRIYPLTATELTQNCQTNGAPSDDEVAAIDLSGDDLNDGGMSELSDAYWRYLKNHAQDDQWAWLEVDHFDSPETVWPQLLELVDTAPDREALAYIGAGPLEDLLLQHGPTVIDRIELEVRRRPKLVEALANVWSDGFESAVMSRITAIVPDRESHES